MELVLDGALDIACGVHVSEEFALHVEDLCVAGRIEFYDRLCCNGGACFFGVDLGVSEVEGAGGVAVFGVLASFAKDLRFVHGIAEFEA